MVTTQTEATAPAQVTMESLCAMSNELRNAVEMLGVAWAEFKYGGGTAPDLAVDKVPVSERMEYVYSQMQEQTKRLYQLADDIRRRV